MTVTTLNAIRAKFPCVAGWTKLLSYLGKTQADDEPLDLLTIIDSNGLDDALWVLDRTGCDERLARHFAAWCAEQVLPIFEVTHPDDKRPREAIMVARDDTATPERRAAARTSALNAGWAATSNAAQNAAWSAAWSAARDAARTAARTSTSPAALKSQETQLRKMLTGAA